MNDLTKAAKTVNWETLRRLRYGDLLKLIRYRWGACVPDDDAGNPDLFELLMLAWMAPTGGEKKVRNAIEVYAPWMRQSRDAGRAFERSPILAQRKSKPKPWTEAGVSKSTWYRRLRLDGVQTIVGKKEHHGVSPESAEGTGRGQQRSVGAKTSSEVTNETSDESQRESKPLLISRHTQSH